MKAKTAIAIGIVLSLTLDASVITGDYLVSLALTRLKILRHLHPERFLDLKRLSKDQEEAYRISLDRTKRAKPLCEPDSTAASMSTKTREAKRPRLDSLDPSLALSLKRIDGPMPSRYAQSRLALKKPLPPMLRIHIDKRRQRMRVFLNRKMLYSWKVSTARRGYYTPNGTFRPYSLERMHYSRKYHNSPMPWSVFFKGGYAIHGTYALGRLGHPASHGCVRVHPDHAAKLYRLIRRYGRQRTRIIIGG